MGSAVGDGFSLRELYRDTSSPAFGQSARCQDLLNNLHLGMKKLDEGRASGLLASICSLCRKSPASELAEQLTLLQVYFNTRQLLAPRENNLQILSMQATIGTLILFS